MHNQVAQTKVKNSLSTQANNNFLSMHNSTSSVRIDYKVIMKLEIAIQVAESSQQITELPRTLLKG